LLAIAASHVIGPVTGATTVSFITCYEDRMLGYYLQCVRIDIKRLEDVVTSLPACEEEREKRREEWIFFYCCQLGIISLFVVVPWCGCSSSTGTFENPVEEPLPVVQELSMDTHLLAWIWMVIVAVPLLEQGITTHTSLGWGPAYLFAVCRALHCTPGCQMPCS
jgi:hypothetical protein